MRTILILISTFIFLNCFSQNEFDKEYKQKGDSLIIALVGKDNFEKYFEFQHYSWSDYITKNGKERIVAFDQRIRKNASFKKYNFRYLLKIDSLDYEKLFAFEIVDDNTNTINNQIDIIPSYLRKGVKCNLINKKEAIEIAVQNSLKNIDSNWVTFLMFDKEIEGFVWTIIGTIELISPKPYYAAIVNIIEINAITKEIISFVERERLDAMP